MEYNVDDDFDKAMLYVESMLKDFEATYALKVKCIHVSDKEELQSLIMFACHQLGVKYEKTEQKETYCTA